jgi:hypothetical protein
LQAIIGNYAVPILEEKPVWGTTDLTRTAYLDTQAGRGSGPGCSHCCYLLPAVFAALSLQL